MHYLDNAATTRVLPEAASAAQQAMLECFGNPSSLHRMGLDAAHMLQSSRETLAAAVGVKPEEFYFTGSGTASTNICLRSAAYQHRHKKGRIVTTAIEHAATLQTVRDLERNGFETIFLQPDATGHISIEALENALTPDTFLFSCQMVNNELGTVQQIDSFGKLLKEKCPEALFHIDAVQGFCRVPTQPRQWGCDMMSVSGHKIGAPKGIGGLYIRKGLRVHPLCTGGGQENGIYPGTEPLPAIAAFAAACAVRMTKIKENYMRVATLANYFHVQANQKLPYVRWNVRSDIPYIQSISIPGCKSEVMLRILSEEGVYVSAGSACSKGKASGVLTAIALPAAQRDSALRISFCPENTQEDVDALIDAIPKGAKRFGVQ